MFVLDVEEFTKTGLEVLIVPGCDGGDRRTEERKDRRAEWTSGVGNSKIVRIIESVFSNLFPSNEMLRAELGSPRDELR